MTGITILTSAERMAIRGHANAAHSGDGGARMRKASGDRRPRITGGRRINSLRIVPGFRAYGVVMSVVGSATQTFYSITLPRAPRCRGCGQAIRGGCPVVVFDWWGVNSNHRFPTRSYLHADECPVQP